MPLIFEQHINGNAKIGVWEIAEPEDFFLKRVVVKKLISHSQKRLQYLAGRYLLSELYPGFLLDEVRINEAGKPYLSDAAFHFSVSHCRNYAAAIVSEEDVVGIDIEIPQQKIEGIRHKFLSKSEEDILLATGLGSINAFTIGWSIKEAMFKWHGEGLVDFKKHLSITNINNQHGQLIADCMYTGNYEVLLNAPVLQINNFILSWVQSKREQ